MNQSQQRFQELQTQLQEAKQKQLTELDLSNDWTTKDEDKLKQIPEH